MRPLWNFYIKYFRHFYGIFCIFTLIMALHFKIILSQSQTALICFWVFLIYFIGMDIYAKNKPLSLLPVFGYLIGYYIIYWSSICEMLSVLWHGFIK